MLEKLIKEPLSLTYLTAVSDMANFVEKCEAEKVKPKEIIKHLKLCGKNAEMSIDVLLNDMEKASTTRS